MKISTVQLQGSCNQEDNTVLSNSKSLPNLLRAFVSTVWPEWTWQQSSESTRHQFGKVSCIPWITQGLAFIHDVSSGDHLTRFISTYASFFQGLDSIRKDASAGQKGDGPVYKLPSIAGTGPTISASNRRHYYTIADNIL